MNRLSLFRKAIPRWADGAVMYQIYPRSFQDSNADGIGDIPGIISRLDYLKDLGVTGMWLSPFYRSPMADFGYDVADYRDVDPIFGTLDDFKRLLEESHARGLHVIIDIVPNHSSDEHPWFLTSKASRDNEHSDWYIWRDPAGYENSTPLPPNNWLDIFAGKSAWEWVPEREQFYLHTFHTRQPDLNWQNPEVRAAMKDMLRFWLDMGVDGFRVDAVPYLGKDPDLRDNPINPHYKPGSGNEYHSLLHENDQHWPKQYDYLNEMASVLKEKRFSSKHRFMITEGYTKGIDPVKEYMNYYKGVDPTVAAPFIFEGIHLPWEIDAWQRFLQEFHDALKKVHPLALASYAFGNHDQSRLLTRLGEDKARAAALMKLTLPGMIFVYYGEDIGMHDVKIPKSQIQDPGAVGQEDKGRDPERTPMQWSGEQNAGFSKASKTWLPVAKDYKETNVDQEAKDPTSFLNLYRGLINLRRSSTALARGDITVLPRTNAPVLAYKRKSGHEQFIVAINFSEEEHNYKLERPGKIIMSSQDGKTNNSPIRDRIHLKPNEGVLVKISK